MAWVLCDLRAMTFQLTPAIYYTGMWYMQQGKRYAYMTSKDYEAYAYGTKDVAEAAAKRLQFENIYILVVKEIPKLERSVNRKQGFRRRIE